MTTNTETENQETAIRWLLKNRRPDINAEQAIQTLRLALGSDPAALRILDTLMQESQG